jgi:hypothetical protein
LQREIDWQILESAKIEAQQARVRENRYASDLYIWCGTLTEVRFGEIVGATGLQSGEGTRLRAHL